MGKRKENEGDSSTIQHGSLKLTLGNGTVADEVSDGPFASHLRGAEDADEITTRVGLGFPAGGVDGDVGARLDPPAHLVFKLEQGGLGVLGMDPAGVLDLGEDHRDHALRGHVGEVELLGGPFGQLRLGHVRVVALLTPDGMALLAVELGRRPARRVVRVGGCAGSGNCKGSRGCWGCGSWRRRHVLNRKENKLNNDNHHNHNTHKPKGKKGRKGRTKRKGENKTKMSKKEKGRWGDKRVDVTNPCTLCWWTREGKCRDERKPGKP